jgi:hypothetical protein
MEMQYFVGCAPGTPVCMHRITPGGYTAPNPAEATGRVHLSNIAITSVENNLCGLKISVRNKVFAGTWAAPCDRT